MSDRGAPWHEGNVTFLEHFFVSGNVSALFERSCFWKASLVVGEDDSLQRFLVAVCQKHCADPRDKIYALQGLADTKDRLAVDYAKPTQQVYVDSCNKLYAGYVGRCCSGWPSSDELYGQLRTLEKLADYRGFTENEICVLGFSLRQRYKQTIPHTSSRIEELTVGIAFRNGVKHGSTT
jgi:hypothetical protein